MYLLRNPFQVCRSVLCSIKGLQIQNIRAALSKCPLFRRSTIPLPWKPYALAAELRREKFTSEYSVYIAYSRVKNGRTMAMEFGLPKTCWLFWLTLQKKHCVLKAVHPSPLSAHRGFLGCKHFSQANDYLKKNGKKPIDWCTLPVDENLAWSGQ